MKIVGTFEAKTHLSTLLEQVEGGAEITITRHGKAVARLDELGYPVLFYENTDGGHSAAANLKETAKRIALEWTYLSRKLMDDRAPTP